MEIGEKEEKQNKEKDTILKAGNATFYFNNYDVINASFETVRDLAI